MKKAHGKSDQNHFKSPLNVSSYENRVDRMFRRCTIEENVLKLPVPDIMVSESLPYTQPLVHLLRIAVPQGLLNPGIRQTCAGDVLLTNSR